MSNFEFIKQLFRCMLGKHDWIVMYRGIEGIEKDCRCCGKRSSTDGAISLRPRGKIE